MQDRTASNSENQDVSDEATSGTIGGSEYLGSTDGDGKGNSAQDIAKMVFDFVSGANAFTEGMDKSDEVKLLRLRTRKNEIVIVPG